MNFKSEGPPFKNFHPVTDPRYGDVCHCTKDSHFATYIKYSRTYISKKEAVGVVEDIKKRLNCKSKFFVPPADFRFEHIRHFCTNECIVGLFVQKPKCDLKQEISFRIKNNISFTGRELMRLIYQTIRGMEAVYGMGLTHTKVGPEWIERSQRGYRVIDDPLHDKNICEELNSRTKAFYLSPEAYKFVR